MISCSSSRWPSGFDGPVAKPAPAAGYAELINTLTNTMSTTTNTPCLVRVVDRRAKSDSMRLGITDTRRSELDKHVDEVITSARASDYTMADCMAAISEEARNPNELAYIISIMHVYLITVYPSTILNAILR